MGGTLPRTYRIGTVLILLAIVPLVGASWFAVREVVDSRAETRTVAEIDAAVQELVVLSELRTRLVDELNWTAAEDGLAQVGLQPGLVRALTGIDVPAQAIDSADRVDRVLGSLDSSNGDLEERIAMVRATRADPDTDTTALYADLEVTIATRAERRMEGVVALAGAVSDSSPLIEGLQALEAATVARQALSAEFNNYFEAQFSDLEDRADEIREVIGASRVRLDALHRIDGLAAPGSAAAGALRMIESSSEALAFDEEVRRFTASNMTGAADAEALTASVAELGDVARTFKNSNVATQQYFELVDAAGTDVYAATDHAHSEAARRNTIALFALVGLVAGTIVVAFAATQAIARPVRQLAAMARSIRDGDSDGPSLNPTGPLEVREAALAIKEASASLALVERQALAMADGDLAHESLAETGSGTLGASLQSAVRTLAASLHEREELRERISHDANHDGLTHLPNRNASMVQLQAGVERTARTGERLAVLFVDLDGFKQVNDDLGHHAGDAVLQVVAERLAAGMAPGDHIGRIGGDEFVVIAEPVDGEDDALRRAAALHASLEQPVVVDSTPVRLGASVGIALGSGSGTPASELLRDADLALYRAKELGRSRTQICDDELRAALAARAELEQALRQALSNDEFVLHYQPIIDARTKSVVAQEALLRWHRPGHGRVDPGAFIPFAERTDLIIHIDRWVTRAVARQMAAWDEGGRTSTPVALNVSGRHLATDDFVETLTRAVEEFGIDPGRLVVEITESALVEDLTTAASKLRSLRERGVRIAIDDFGTGYTSLAHLKWLPVDILKIDRSYVADDSAASLMKLIIDTGHLLGASVTAEGVETAEQEALLIAMGADELQGFRYGRPSPNPCGHPRRTEDYAMARSSTILPRVLPDSR